MPALQRTRDTDWWIDHQLSKQGSLMLLRDKSQEQTFDKVGVYLPKPIFSHEQLYVAISRVISRAGLKVLALDENGEPTIETRNIVYHEVLSTL
jgi:hypothetical protein